jgi:hypothetical protein
VNFFLEIHSDFDYYYFNETSLEHSIIFNLPMTMKDLLEIASASLLQKKYVYIANTKFNENIHIPVRHRSKHYLIEEDQFIFLNYSIKNHLKNIQNTSDIFDTYQKLEACFKRNPLKIS